MNNNNNNKSLEREKNGYKPNPDNHSPPHTLPQKSVIRNDFKPQIRERQSQFQ